jgi:phosphoribosylformylglycinamidine synthase
VVGGNRSHTAIIDNFCWCDSKNPSRLGQLKEAAKGLHDAAVAYMTPIISGKDSMFNDFKGFTGEGIPVHVSIPPTLLISSLSVMDDVRHVVSLDVKAAGDYIYVLGETHEELGGSEYASLIDEHNTFFSPVPHVDCSKNRSVYDTYSQCLQQGFIASAIGVGRGGLAAAVAKVSIAGDLGVSISFEKLKGTVKMDQAALFSESQGRILVTINPRYKEEFEKLCFNIPLSYLGTVEKEAAIKVTGLKGRSIVSVPLSKSVHAYKSTFGILHHHKPAALIVAGYGINCEEETAFAFTKAGGEKHSVGSTH